MCNIYVVSRGSACGNYTSPMLVRFNNNLGYLCLYSLMCSMLDSVQQVQVFLKYMHTLRAGFAWHRNNPNRHPHAHNGCYKYNHWVLNLLTACGYQVTFELYCKTWLWLWLAYIHRSHQKFTRIIIRNKLLYSYKGN